MTALTAARTRKQRRNRTTDNWPIKAASQIWQNGLVVLLAGVAVAARAGVDAAEALTMKTVGIAANSVLGGAANGDVRIDTDRGTFLFAIGAAGDALTLSDVGADVYVIDDQTVGKTSATNTRPKAGVLEDVSSEGAWVRVGV